MSLFYENCLFPVIFPMSSLDPVSASHLMICWFITELIELIRLFHHTVAFDTEDAAMRSLQSSTVFLSS